jgi:hypothetical protein
MTTLETIIAHYEQLSLEGSNQAYVVAKYLRKYLESENAQLEKAYQKGFDEATTQGIKEAHKYQ